MNYKLALATLLMGASAVAVAADQQVGHTATLELQSSSPVDLVEIQNPIATVSTEQLSRSLDKTLNRVSAQLSYEIETFLEFRETEL